MTTITKIASLGAVLSLVPTTNDSILMTCLLSVSIITIIKY
jgi:hypothetical protein